MGKGEKPGLMGSKWTTIVLVALLVILIAIFIWIQSTGGLENFFQKFKSKRKAAPPPLKPSVMNGEFKILDDLAKLNSIDSRLTLVAELSWRKPA